MEYSDPGSAQLPLTLPIPTSQVGEPLLELVENREYAVPLPTASASPNAYIPKVGSVNAVPPGRSSLIVFVTVVLLAPRTVRSQTQYVPGQLACELVLPLT